MGKARSKLSRKGHSKSLTAHTTAKDSSSTQDNNNSYSSNYYESFPMLPRTSRSRSSSPSSNPSKIRSQSPDKIFESGMLNTNINDPSRSTPGTVGEVSKKDPGNPLGNAVDFCVNNLQILHSRSIDMNSLLSSGAEFKHPSNPCPEPNEPNYELFLADLFLCNLKVSTKNRVSNGDSNRETVNVGDNSDENSQDNSLLSSSVYSKKSKQGRKKKSVTIMPGKKFMRSMSFKRKKSSLANKNDYGSNASSNYDDKQSLGSKGSKDRTKAASGVADDNILSAIQPCDSEDSIFANLDNEAEPDVFTAQQADDSSGSLWQLSSSLSPTTRTSTTIATKKEKRMKAKMELGSIGASNSGDDSAQNDEGPDQQSFDGSLKNDNIDSCNLLLCASSLVEGTVHPIENTNTSEQREKQEQRDLESESSRDSKQTSDGTQIPEISIVQQPPNRSRRNHRLKNTMTSKKTKTNSHYKNDDDENLEPKIEFEMILDDSRFGGRRWGKITPWKKLFLASSSIASSSTSNTYRIKKRSKTRSSSMDDKSKPKQRNDSTRPEFNLDDTADFKHATQTMNSNLNERNSKIMRRRQLQSALQSSSSSYSSRRNQDFKRKRKSWRKMMVVSVPPGKQGTIMNTKKVIRETETAELSNEKSRVSKPKKIDEENHRENMSVELENRSRNTDLLHYSESDEDESEEGMTPKSKSRSRTTVKDQSSTSVMGLHNWSWGVFAMDLRDDDDARVRKGYDSMPFFGGAITDENCCQQNSQEDCSYYDDEDNITNHDGWIMDEDQLVSFETDDDTRRTSENSYATSSNYSVNTYNNREDDETVDREFEAAIADARSKPVKTTQESTNTTQKRKGHFAAALSKSFRKSFSIKKKQKGSIDISNDVNVKATDPDAASSSGRHTTGTDQPVFGDASEIEAVLQTKSKRSRKASAAITSFEDRDDSSAVSESRSRVDHNRSAAPTNVRSSIANRRSKRYWKEQNKPQPGPKTAKNPELNTVSTTTRKSGNRVPWRTSKPPLSSSPLPSQNDGAEKSANETPTKDIITVTTNNSGTGFGVAAAASILSKKSNEYLDRYAALFDQDDDEYEYDSSYASSSTNSRSWARNSDDGSWAMDDDDVDDDKDDEYVQTRSYRFVYNESPPSSHDIIRE